MNNPISFIKNTRTTYSMQYRKNVTEVLVQFSDENPAWIPMDTLEAMMTTLLAVKREVAG
jgi:hypothetical protein